MKKQRHRTLLTTLMDKVFQYLKNIFENDKVPLPEDGQKTRWVCQKIAGVINRRRVPDGEVEYFLDRGWSIGRKCKNEKGNK